MIATQKRGETELVLGRGGDGFKAQLGGRRLSVAAGSENEGGGFLPHFLAEFIVPAFVFEAAFGLEFFYRVLELVAGDGEGIQEADTLAEDWGGWGDSEGGVETVRHREVLMLVHFED